MKGLLDVQPLFKRVPNHCLKPPGDRVLTSPGDKLCKLLHSNSFHSQEIPPYFEWFSFYKIPPTVSCPTADTTEIKSTPPSL